MRRALKFALFGLAGLLLAGAILALLAAWYGERRRQRVMPRYDNVDKFRAMLRAGKRPDGSAVSPVMPFDSLRNLSDTDVGAVYVFLGTLPARPAGEH